MGLAVVSLYGEERRPRREDLADCDLLVLDIQDVGTRFYTYITTGGYVLDCLRTWLLSHELYRRSHRPRERAERSNASSVRGGESRVSPRTLGALPRRYQ